MSIEPRAVIGSELRIVRLLSIGAGAVAAITIVVDQVLVDQPGATVVPLWYQLAIIAVSGFPILIGAVATFSSARTLRRLNGVAALSRVLLLALIWPALAAHPDTAGAKLPWMLTVTGLAVVAAVITWGQVGGWAVLAALTLLLLGARMRLHDFTPTSNVNDHHTLVTAMLLVVACSALIAAGRALDASAEETAAVATRQARERARRSALVRTQALVHDDILVTLVFASQNLALLNPAVAKDARRIRTLIADRAEGGGDERPSTARDFATEASRITREIDSSAVFTWLPDHAPDDAGAGAAFIDPDAAATLLGALRQALVNSVNHAGASSSRAVTLTSDEVEGWLRLTVADDGRGFDIRTIPHGRMGIASSILARLDSLAGGSARVQSRPGAGTLVALGWRTTAETASEVRETARGSGAETVGGPGRAEPLSAESTRRSFRRGVTVAAAVFLLVQLALAVNAAENSATPWLSLLTLAGVWLSVFSLGWRSIRRPTLARSAVTVALVTATAALMLLLATPGSMNYWHSWYLTSCALLLFALAARGRVLLAVAGLVALAAVTVIAAAGGFYSGTDLAISIARPVAIVSVGGSFALAIAVYRRKIRALREESLRITQLEAYESASRLELQAGARQLETEIGPMLERLEGLSSAGAVLSPEEARECAALEGMLRDRYRGGRLAAEPVVSAAMAARRRGIDVVLLDDAACAELPPQELAAVLEWMAGLMAEARGGPVVGRMLPSGRDGIASVVSDGSATLFRGRAAPRSDVGARRFEA